MKQCIILWVFIAMISLFANDAFAQNTQSRNDSIAAVLKVNGLQTKRDRILNEIKVQDAKRNKQIVGVSPETLEEINDRQDSICLALRSELIDVILEIKENSPEVNSPLLLQHYNNLVHKKEQPTSDQENSQVQNHPNNQ